MSALSKKKIALFEKFSKNLRMVSDVSNFRINPERGDDLYVCPLAFRVFEKEGLSEKYDDQLTLEHVPPDSLNGKGVCLTSRTQNSTSGHSLDLILQDHIKRRDYKQGLAPYETVGYIDGIKTPLEICQTDGKPEIWFKPKSQHLGLYRLEQKIKSGGEINFQFSHLQDGRKLDVSLLRTAYLLAFSQIGYSLLFGLTDPVNQHYQHIRDQIANPDKLIIPDIVYLNEKLPDFLIGVNLVIKPSEMRSVLVVFDLKKKTTSYRYGVFLPCPDDYGFRGFPWIRKSLDENGSVNQQLFHIRDLDITSKKDSIVLYDEWEHRIGILED